ncbi:MAG: hypothetical protein V4805_05280 [Pseudomonadota bacterium]
MTEKCTEIELDDALPGMVLFDDLLDGNGKILLPRGATLSDATINSLRRRDIQSLRIVAARDEAAENLADQQARVLQQARLIKLFRKHGDDGANPVLMRWLTSYRMEV